MLNPTEDRSSGVYGSTTLRWSVVLPAIPDSAIMRVAAGTAGAAAGPGAAGPATGAAGPGAAGPGAAAGNLPLLDLSVAAVNRNRCQQPIVVTA